MGRACHEEEPDTLRRWSSTAASDCRPGMRQGKEMKAVADLDTCSAHTAERLHLHKVPRIHHVVLLSTLE